MAFAVSLSLLQILPRHHGVPRVFSQSSSYTISVGFGSVLERSDIASERTVESSRRRIVTTAIEEHVYRRQHFARG